MNGLNFHRTPLSRRLPLLARLIQCVPFIPGRVELPAQRGAPFLPQRVVTKTLSRLALAVTLQPG